jgi:hypothetical protein
MYDFFAAIPFRPPYRLSVPLSPPLRLSRQEESRVAQERLFELIDSLPATQDSLSLFLLAARRAPASERRGPSRIEDSPSKISIIERV